MVFVCGCTELQSGKFLDVTLEYVCHIIVELVAERAYMHGHNGFIEFLFMVAYLCGKKLEVGNGAGVVKFDGVGIQADKLYPSCNEGEIGVSEYCTISLFARAQAVVIAEKYHIGYLEFVHNVPLPKELVCYTEVTDVSAMNDEIYVVPLVEVAYKVVGLVIPALGITHCYEPDCCLVLAVLLYLGNVVGIDIGFTADVYIVRVIIYHVAAGYKQA